MTDVSADWAAWVSAAGTISATVAALYIAQRGWREARRERISRDAAQARQILQQQDGATIKITNFSQAPILQVEVRNAVDELRGVYYGARLRDAGPQDFLAVLGPQETAVLDITTGSGQPADPAGSYIVTVIFTDAAGLDWGREGNATPYWIVAGRDSPGLTGAALERSARQAARSARSRYGPA